MTRRSEPSGRRIMRIATAPASATAFSNCSTFDIGTSSRIPCVLGTSPPLAQFTPLLRCHHQMLSAFTRSAANCLHCLGAFPYYVLKRGENVENVEIHFCRIDGLSDRAQIAVRV